MYSPRGIFDPNIFTESQLLQLKDMAFGLMLQGKTVMSWSGEGTAANRQFTMPIDQMLVEITWSLKSQNPAKYGFLAYGARQWRF